MPTLTTNMIDSTYIPPHPPTGGMRSSLIRANFLKFQCPMSCRERESTSRTSPYSITIHCLYIGRAYTCIHIYIYAVRFVESSTASARGWDTAGPGAPPSARASHAFLPRIRCLLWMLCRLATTRNSCGISDSYIHIGHGRMLLRLKK